MPIFPAYGMHGKKKCGGNQPKLLTGYSYAKSRRNTGKTGRLSILYHSVGGNASVVAASSQSTSEKEISVLYLRKERGWSNKDVN